MSKSARLSTKMCTVSHMTLSTRLTKHFVHCDTCQNRNLCEEMFTPWNVSIWKRVNWDTSDKIFCTLWNVILWARFKPNFVRCAMWHNGQVSKMFYRMQHVTNGHLSHIILYSAILSYSGIHHRNIWTLWHVRHERLVGNNACDFEYVLGKSFSAWGVAKEILYSGTWVTASIVQRHTCHPKIFVITTRVNMHTFQNKFSTESQVAFLRSMSRSHVYHQFRTEWHVSECDNCKSI